MSAGAKVFWIYYILVSIFIFVQWCLSIAGFGYAVKSVRTLGENNQVVYKAFLRAICGFTAFQGLMALIYQFLSALLVKQIRQEDADSPGRSDILSLYTFNTSIAIVAAGTLMNNANIQDVQAKLIQYQGLTDSQKKLLIGMFGYSIWMLLLMWGFIVAIITTKRAAPKQFGGGGVGADVQMSDI